MSERTVKPILGQCHCGNIRYEAQPPIVKSSYCDCPGCQKATGTFKAPFVTVHQKEFRVIAGEPSSFRADSGVMCDAYGEWYFCSKCGTHIFWKPNESDELDIFAGTLDDTELFQPKE